MAKIVNEKVSEIRILMTKLTQFEKIGITREFLDESTNPSMSSFGVKRNNYYLVDTEAVLRATQKWEFQFKKMVKILSRANFNNFRYISILCQ